MGGSLCQEFSGYSGSAYRIECLVRFKIAG